MSVSLVLVLKDLANNILPLPTQGRKKETTRIQGAPKKVPNFHLTGPESMEYITEADGRAKEKAKETEKMEKVKKEAVKAAKAAERKPKCKIKKSRK